MGVIAYPHRCIISNSSEISDECLLKVVSITLHEQPDDETEETENGSKDFDGENLDESAEVRTISRRAIGCTHSEGSAASARAALLPLMPTQTPQIRLHMPTVNPAQNSAYPVKMFDGVNISSYWLMLFSFAEKMMAMMTP